MILSILILLLIVFNILFPVIKANHKYDYSEFDKEVTGFLRTQEVITAKPKTYKQKDPFNIFDLKASAAEQKMNPFPFDPNTLSYKEFLDLGLTPHQAVTILKYRTKGGKFFKKEDLKRIYGISAEEYQALEPYIEIKSEKKEATPKAKTTERVLVDINSANADDLKKIKGIGDYFAYQIMKYRGRLGGYYSKEQLREVSKMDSARYDSISPFVIVENKAVRKLNVNTATFEELNAHPYIGYNIALSLINYRTKHGPFQTIADIKKSALITDKNYPKISYYLCTE